MARGRTYRKRKSDGSWSRWHAVIDAPKTVDAQRRQITRTFDTQREAHAWLASVNTGATQVLPQSAPSLADWMQTWLSKQSLAKSSTLATYRCHVERHITPSIGRIPLTGLSHDDIFQFVCDLSGANMAPATVHRIVATLRCALGAAVRSGHIAVNPVDGVRLPTVPARPHTIWNVDQASRFLDSCSRDSMGVLLRLALMTGMRRGELLGLTWPDIDFETRSLVVRASRVAVGGEVVTGSPKSRVGVRRIYLDADTCRALNGWQWSQARCIGPNDGLVFTHPNGDAFQPWWVSRTFERRIETLGLPRIRFHDLRHTSATIGLTAGESLKEVSARLGHADIAITANVYGEVLPHTAAASSNRRANLLGASTPALSVVAS